MAINYNRNYNAKISRVVRNFNQNRNRAIKRGFKNVPPPIRVSDLKARYTTRRDLNKQLNILSQFKTGREGKLLTKIENQGGARAIEWEFQYLKSNAENAKKFFLDQYKLIASKVNDMPGERMQLSTLASKIKTLELDEAYMSQSQFNSYRSAIKEFVNKPRRYGPAYRGFLKQVENVMRYLNMSDLDIKKVFDKLGELTPEQFHNLYQNSPLISRIYGLANSPELDGTIKINTTDENAKEIVDTFVSDLDSLMEFAKEDPEPEMPIEPAVEFYRDFIDSKVPSTVRQSHIIPKEKLDKKQIANIKALGWDEILPKEYRNK